MFPNFNELTLHIIAAYGTKLNSCQLTKQVAETVPPRALGLMVTDSALSIVDNSRAWSVCIACDFRTNIGLCFPKNCICIVIYRAKFTQATWNIKSFYTIDCFIENNVLISYCDNNNKDYSRHVQYNSSQM